MNFTVLTDYKKKKVQKEEEGEGRRQLGPEREKSLPGLCLASNTAGPAPHPATFVKWNKY